MLWGKDLFAHLDDIYQNQGRYCVLFVSEAYGRKVWTTHERESAQARALRAHEEYVLPARFDDTAIPGLRSTLGYVDLREKSPSELSDLIAKKVGPRQRSNFFPPEPDLLVKYSGAKTDRAQTRVVRQAQVLFEAFERMSRDERRVVAVAFLHGCPAEFPDNVHLATDLIRRHTSFTPSKIRRLLGGIRSLGFDVTERDFADHDSERHLGNMHQYVVEFHVLRSGFIGPSTEVADLVLRCAVNGYCESHAIEALVNADFSKLASATDEGDHHEPRNRSERRDSKNRRSRRAPASYRLSQPDSPLGSLDAEDPPDLGTDKPGGE
jgi:hypothetical protein